MLQRLAVLLQQQSSCKGVVAAAFWSARRLHSVLQAESSVNKAASSENNNKPRRIDSLARQVSRLIKQNKEDVATGLLPQMAAQERPPTVVYCNYLLNSCARARNPTMAKEVYRFMKRNGLKMDAISYGCFLRTLSRSGLLHEALELLEVLAQSKEEDVKANIIMYNTVLNGCGLAKSKAHTDRCLQLMEKHGVHKDEMSYVELIKLSGLLRDSKTALHWWNELIKNGSPSPSSRCTLIVALCRANALPEALQALQEMSHVLSDNRPFHLLPGKKRRPSTVEASDPLPVSLAVGNKDSPLEVETDMPRGEGQTSKVEEEEEEERDGDSGSQNDGHNIKKNVEGFHHWEVRKEMQDAYNALINAAGQAGKYKLAESLFSEMRSLGLRLSIYTFNALLRAVVEGRGIEHALRVVRSMEAVGMRPDTHTITTLLDGYCRKGQLDKAEALLEQMRDGKPREKPSIYTYNILIRACGPPLDDAWEIFKEMRALGVKPDLFTFNILINACAHRKSLSSAFELIDVMQEDGIAADIVTYNSLIKVACHSGDLDVGLKVLKEMKDRGVKPVVATFNTLLSSCSYHKYRELAEYVVEEMRHAKVRPDTHTCSQVVSLYMRCGDMNEAAQALHVLSARMVSEDNAGQDINELFDDESAEQTGQDELFEEAVLSPQPLAQAAYTIALAGLAQGASDTQEAEKTPWATRLALQHERWKGSDTLIS
ncbi:unnamed protein product [Sphagnum balticum]